MCAIGTPSVDQFITVINVSLHLIPAVLIVSARLYPRMIPLTCIFSQTICPATPIPAPPVTYKMCSACSASTITTPVPGINTATCNSCIGYVVETPRVHTPVPSTPAYTITAASSGRLPVTPSVSPTSKIVVAGATKNAAVSGALVGIVGVIIALL